MILAGDIGGTKTHLAYFTMEDGALSLSLLESYPSQNYRSLNEVLQAMLRDHPAEVTAAAFGIAGPVVNSKSNLTNLGWEVDARDVASMLHLRGVGLINDLQATAYGALRLRESDMKVLNPGTPQPHATIAVIAAGTGLGEGGLVWDGKRYVAIASEGGHTDFAPRTDLEIDLLRFLLTRHEHVSYERLISGPGILNLYEFFRSKADYPEPDWLRQERSSGDPSAAVSQAAVDERDKVCALALELFVSLYGAEAGNLALKLLATGGVYIGGGIAPKILARISDGSFMQAFTAKGRHGGLLKKIPVRVILNDKTALFGAAHYALMIYE
jgi:glucokinase